jgi:hypothetical protein
VKPTCSTPQGRHHKTSGKTAARSFQAAEMVGPLRVDVTYQSNCGPRRIRMGPPSISSTLNTRVPRVTMTRCSRMRCTRTLRILGIKGLQTLSSLIDRAICEGQTDTARSR